MSYSFADRIKEWTTYVGVATVGLAAAIPAMFPAADHHWVQFWQAAQYILGAALAFIPQTAGTQAVEREAFSLLRAFAQQLPPDYAAALTPALNILGQAAIQVSAGVPLAPPPDNSQRVVATPVYNSNPAPAAPPPAPAPLPEPVPGVSQ